MTTRTRNLSIQRADLTVGDVGYTRHRFTVVDGAWQVLDRKGVAVASGTGVVNVEPVAGARSTWRVDLDTGESFAVTRSSGCGCGGR